MGNKLNRIIKSNLKKILKENTEDSNIDIVITKIEPDERGSRKQREKYHVNYQITIDGNLMEIEGELNPYYTGRDVEFSFEPDYFMDEESEKYYDDNWEDIETQILDKFYS